MERLSSPPGEYGPKRHLKLACTVGHQAVVSSFLVLICSEVLPLFPSG